MVDARGLSCPIPVIMTQKAMKSKEDYYEVMVDVGSSRKRDTLCREPGIQGRCRRQRRRVSAEDFQIIRVSNKTARSAGRCRADSALIIVSDEL